MKRILIVLVTLSVVGISCTKKPNFVIEGIFKNGAKKMLVLERLNINITVAIDSLKIKNNNTFRFTVYTDHPDIYLLRNTDGRIINFLPSPGEKIIVEGDYVEFEKNYNISGSEESEHVKQLVERLTETRENLRKLDDEFSKNPDLTQNLTSDYINKQKEIIKDQRDFSIRFIVENIKSLSSIYALYQKFGADQLVLGTNRDIQYMKIVADSLSVKYPDVPLVKSFVNDARTAEKRYYTMLGLQKKLKDVKANMPDIELPDMQGNISKLSSLKGKTVLLYFWSPLSEDFKAKNQDLLQTYSAYKNRGFEIYAVGLSADLTAWANTIIFDNLIWRNVIEQDVVNSSLYREYNINNIPTNFLINNEGEIVARDLYGSELRIWLDNIIK